MQELTATLIEKAKSLLAEGKVQKVIGWRKGLFEDDITPSVFESVEDLEQNFVFNKYCEANLSKYLVKVTRDIEIAKSTTRVNNAMAKQRDPAAQDKPIPQEVILVFLKPGDSHSFTQLLKENRITHHWYSNPFLPTDDMADPHQHNHDALKGLNGHFEIALYVDTFEEVDEAYKKAVENGAT